MLPRRRFLQGAGAVALGGLALPLRAGPPPDWRLGWRTVRRHELPALAMEVEGDVPPELSGTLLRNGPARFERGDRRYRHWFDGDGMLQQFRIADGGIAHRGRFIETAKYLEEREAGRLLYDGAGTHFPDARPARNNDSINTANIALLPWDHEVLALWEGGSAYRVDGDSLETLGVKNWGEGLAHMPFSAHPLREDDGSVWNFGFAPYAGDGGTLVIYRLRPGSGMETVKTVPLPFAGYLHDFAQTAGQLVFLVPPYRYDAGAGQTFVDRFLWEPGRGSRLLVVDKDDLDRQQWFELPAGFVFHFGHASVDGGELRLQLCWYDDPALMASGMRSLLESRRASPPVPAHAATVVADLRGGSARLEKSDTVLEFPGFAGSVPGRDAPVHGAGREIDDAGREIDTLTVWDPGRGVSAQYRYPHGVLAEEPLLAGAAPSWLLQTFLDCRSGHSGVNVFAADAVGDGPRATATMDRALPLGFHGTFLAGGAPA